MVELPARAPICKAQFRRQQQHFKYCQRLLSIHNRAYSAPTSSCWLPINASDQLNITPAQTIHIPQYFYRIGFTPGATVYAWVQTQAGHVSAPATATITYQPATPPVLVNVLATVSNTPSSPLANSDEIIPTCRPMASSAGTPLPPMDSALTPIALYSTTDDVSFTSIASALPNAALRNRLHAPGNRYRFFCLDR